MPPSTKKISVLIDLQIIRQMEDAQLTQTEAVTRGLEILFSSDWKKITEYKQQIISDAQKIAVLEARLTESEAHRATLERELGQVHEEYRAHLGQVQTALKMLEDERQIKEENRRLLEDGIKKRCWWKFW